MHSYLRSLLLLLFIIQFLPAEFNSHHWHGNNERFLGRYPYQKITPSPINISSKDAHNVTLKPVILRGILNEKVKLINTGQSVEYIVEHEETDSEISGGPLLNDKYKFKKVRFYWVNDINGVAGTTVNGKDGAPLEAVGYFYNKKYESFTNAIKHRDGLALISFRIKIREIDNPLFKPFAKSLEKIRHAGSSTSTTLGTAIKWYSGFPPQTSYYAFPGAYTDERTRKQYYCTTTIIIPNYPNMYLSKRQFHKTFLSLKNKAGGPLMNKAHQSPRTQPVVQSTKVTQFLIPTGRCSTQKSLQQQQELIRSKNQENQSGNQNENESGDQNEKESENQAEKSENQHQQESENEDHIQQNEKESENQEEKPKNQHQKESEKEDHIQQNEKESENQEEKPKNQHQKESENENQIQQSPSTC